MSILYRSAFGLADDIKGGKLSSVSVLEFYLERIERFNEQLNAVVALSADIALVRALEADQAAARGENWGPLHGVPMTIKDAWCTKGLVTTGGAAEHRSNIPRAHAAGVQRLIDAGAIIFAKSNVPYMSGDLQTFNDVYGVTNNPWDKERTCGGSSGGAAAGVAAGLTPLELGSDIGGSIRTPCHFNGVYGHKASFRLISTWGHLPPGEEACSEVDLAAAGPIASCVDDLEKALSLLKGPNPRVASAGALDLPPATFEDASQLRIAVWSDDTFCPVETDIREHIEAAATTLERMGAAVNRRARPAIDPQENDNNYQQLLLAVLGADMPDTMYQKALATVAAADADDMSGQLPQMRGIALSHRDWLVQHEQRQRSRAAWQVFFQDYDVLLCPCAPVPAFAHDHQPLQRRRLEVNGQERPYSDLMKWAGLSLNAYLPSTAVPLGTTRGGLPVGMQIVGPYLGDLTTLSVARLLEAHHHAFAPPPGYA